MARSRHRRGGRHRPSPLILGLSAAGAAAAVLAVAVGVSQAASSGACAATVTAAGQAAPAHQASTVSGTATHYVLDGIAGCSFPSPPADGLFVAMPPGEFDGAAACGGYLEVHGPRGSVKAEVIDQCPDCGPRHIDLSQAAFAAIAPLDPGLINVTYQNLASPPLPGPVSVRVKETSSQYWLALLIANTGNPLTSVQVRNQPGGQWQDLAQADYNYWVAQSGAGSGPFSVRLADSAGHVVTVGGITLTPGVVQQTGTWMYGGAGAPPAPASGSPPAVPAPTASASAPAAPQLPVRPPRTPPATRSQRRPRAHAVASPSC